MAISRAQLLKELLPGLNALFGMEYAKYGEEHKEIFESETSDRSFEEETKLSGFSAAPVKNEGSAALARAMAYTKQVKGASILNNAFAAGTTYGDGQTLRSTAHPLVSGGTNSNRPATASDLNETSLEAAVIQIAGWTDERSLLIAARPTKLIIPPALQFVATRLLETEGRVSTADNDINALRNNGSIPEGYAINHYLTDTDAWFLMTDVPNGLKHFTRTPMSTSMDADFDTGNSRYKARERYSFGVSDPLGIFGSPGA